MDQPNLIVFLAQLNHKEYIWLLLKFAFVHIILMKKSAKLVRKIHKFNQLSKMKQKIIVKMDILNLKEIVQNSKFLIQLRQQEIIVLFFLYKWFDYVNIQKIEKLTIYDLNYFYNQKLNYGCIKVIQSSSAEFQVINSNILNNSCNKCVSISSQRAGILYILAQLLIILQIRGRGFIF
ncbi:unnamed protein product [Paramecium pentaurelia]|uniref:Uncharacterized protein n=1 Tax=Paramecium pentaurelia TaxID=43138 RepID=A0A8S1W9M9_9CILI|nr:unnamed protein product [Paramecium pentaurelia]